MTTTMTNEAVTRQGHLESHTVHLLPGEGLWEARHRWQASTGLRGLIVVR